MALRGIPLQQAQLALNAAYEKAWQMGVNMNIVVVDAGASLMAFLRMDCWAAAWQTSTP